MLTNAPKTLDYTIYTQHAYYWHTYYITTLQLVPAQLHNLLPELMDHLLGAPGI